MADQALSDLQAENAALKAENAALKAGLTEAAKPLVEGHPKFVKYPMWVTKEDGSDKQLVQTEADHAALGAGWGPVGVKHASTKGSKKAEPTETEPKS